jgi:hypothetical protein
MAKQNFNFNPLSEFKTPESVYDKDRLKKIGGVNALATVINSLANVYGATKGARIAPQKATNPMLTKLMELSDREDALNYRKSLMALSDSMAEARGERSFERSSAFQKEQQAERFTQSDKQQANRFTENRSLIDLKNKLTQENVEGQRTYKDEARKQEQINALARIKAQGESYRSRTGYDGYIKFGTNGALGTFNAKTGVYDEKLSAEQVPLLYRAIIDEIGKNPQLGKLPGTLSDNPKTQQKFIQDNWPLAQQLLELLSGSGIPEPQGKNVFGGYLDKPTETVTQPTKKNRLPEQKGSLDF